MDKKEQAIQEFLTFHNITIPFYLKEDADGLYSLINIKQSIWQNITLRASELVEESEQTSVITWGMLDRVYDHVEGGFISLFSGAWSSIELICRAAIEAAINVLYVLESDTANRVSQYVSHYFEEASQGVNRYEGVKLKSSDLGRREIISVTRARELLNSRKQHIEALFQYKRIPFGRAGWPKQISERFKKAGREFEYREIYAALSSQVHNDAEALVDYIIIKLTESRVSDSAKKAAREVLFWLRFFIYRSSAFYSDAALLYTKRYELTSAERSIEQYQHEINARLQQISDEFLNGRNTSKL